MTIDEQVSRQHRAADRFFGEALPLELGPRRAAKIFLARLLTVVGAGSLVLLLGFLGTAVDMAYVLAGWVTLLVILTVWSLWRDVVLTQGRAVRWRARFFFPTMFVLFTGTAVTAGSLAVVSDRGPSAILIAVCLVAMVSTFLLGKVTLIRAELAAEKTVEQSLQGVTLARTAQPLVTALGEVVSASSPADKRNAVDVLIRLTVGVAKTVCGRSVTTTGVTRAMFYELVSDSRATRRAYEGTYGGQAPRDYFDAGESLNDRRAIEIAKGVRVLVVNDVDAAPPAHFSDYQGRPYKSFIAVPVRAGGRAFGALLIDSNVPNGLTDVDVGYAILLAGILGAGLATDSSVSTGEDVSPAVDPIGDIAREYDNVFAQDLPATAASFSLSPDPDREFLEALRTRPNAVEIRDAFEVYRRALLDLAEKRAKRGLRQMNHRSTRMFWAESTESVYGSSMLKK